nr:ribonuclease H-like domain-containing protein [Tanacetum cinerariifolium]
MDLPNGKKGIGTKWVFRNIKDERGIMIRNKERLIAQGHTLEEGIDYDKLFTTVARIEAIRLFLAYALFKDFVVYQMDVKSAFLYGKIEEEVYFWSTAMAKTINREAHIHARVDGKKVIITEASIRRDLQLADKEGVDCLPNSTIFKQIKLMGPKTTAWNELSSTVASAIICLATTQKFNFSKWIIDSMIRNLDNVFGKILMYPRVGKGFSGRVTLLFPTMVVPQPSDPMEHVADEAIHKKLGDSLVRAATTASSLEAKKESGNINKTQSKATPNESSSQRTDSGGSPRCQETIGDTTAQTRFESVSKLSNDSLLARGNTLQSDEDRMKLNELMDLCINLQTRVLDLEKTKTSQHNEIASLKRRVKKLKKMNRSKTHKLKRLYKVGLTARVESSGDKESFGEDASKQGRIEAIYADEDITLVNVQNDAEMFYVNDLVNAAQDSTATTTITTKELTLAQALEALKTSKPKDKIKTIMIKEPVKPKKKDQIRLDEEAAKRLQAKLDEEERLTRERAQKEQEANIALIKT